MLVETEIEVLDRQSACLFSNEPFEKRPGTPMEDFGLYSADHFESHLLRWVAAISRLLQIIGLFYRRALLNRRYSVDERSRINIQGCLESCRMSDLYRLFSAKEPYN